MSIYDQIARGVAPIGRDLPQIAQLNENRSRFERIQGGINEERTYQRGRDKAADEAAAAKLKAEHTREQLGAAFFVASKDPDYRRGFELLAEAGIDPAKIEGMPEPQVREIYAELAREYAGLATQQPAKGGAPVKVNRGGKPVYEDPAQAIGQEAFEDQGSEARGTWSPPFQAVGADGQPALFRQHSLTGEIQPVQVGGGGGPAGGGAGGGGGGGGGPQLTPPKSPTQIQAEADAATAANAKQAALNLYETARDGLLKGLESTETGPLAGRIPAFTSAQQTAAGGVAAMAPVLKQLFRVAGEGVFTDRDQALLIAMVPDRTDTPEARKNKIENIDAIVRAKLGMAPAAQSEDPLGIR